MLELRPDALPALGERLFAWGGDRYLVVMHDDVERARRAIEAGPDGDAVVIFGARRRRAMTKLLRLGGRVAVALPTAYSTERTLDLVGALHRAEQGDSL